MSLANTQEPLYLVNRSGNRPSAEGAATRFDQAHALCREVGFRRLTFRGDNDLSQTEHFDRWDAEGIRFMFGFDARATLTVRAEAMDNAAWRTLTRPPVYDVETEPRGRRPNLKDAAIVAREFKNLNLLREALAEFPYRPGACTKTYRMVVVRKMIAVEQGQHLLFERIRHCFYLTNDRLTKRADLAFLANGRGNQQNLIEQLRHGVNATRMPVDTSRNNWAYLVMTALAWTLKAWFALLLPEGGRWRHRYAAEKIAVLSMEFRAFVNALLRVPAQIVIAAGWRFACSPGTSGNTSSCALSVFCRTCDGPDTAGEAGIERPGWPTKLVISPSRPRRSRHARCESNEPATPVHLPGASPFARPERFCQTRLAQLHKPGTAHQVIGSG